MFETGEFERPKFDCIIKSLTYKFHCHSSFIMFLSQISLYKEVEQKETVNGNNEWKQVLLLCMCSLYTILMAKFLLDSNSK